MKHIQLEGIPVDGPLIELYRREETAELVVGRTARAEMQLRIRIVAWVSV
jgi:hypothetical protein